MLLLLAGTMLAACAKEQPVESGRAFLTTVYTDSQRETFSRTTKHLQGTIADRGDTITYVALLGDSGLVQSVDITARSHRHHDLAVQARHFKMPKSTLPLLHGSGALFEQILRRVRAIGGDSVSVPVIRLGRDEVLDVVTVAGNGQDSLILSFQASENARNALHIGIDSTWRITGAVLPLSGMRIQGQE